MQFKLFSYLCRNLHILFGNLRMVVNVCSFARVILITYIYIYLATLSNFFHHHTKRIFYLVKFLRQLNIQIAISMIDRFDLYCNAVFICNSLIPPKSCHTLNHVTLHFCRHLICHAIITAAISYCNIFRNTTII